MSTIRWRGPVDPRDLEETRPEHRSIRDSSPLRSRYDDAPNATGPIEPSRLQTLLEKAETHCGVDDRPKTERRCERRTERRTVRSRRRNHISRSPVPSTPHEMRTRRQHRPSPDSSMIRSAFHRNLYAYHRRRDEDAPRARAGRSPAAADRLASGRVSQRVVAVVCRGVPRRRRGMSIPGARITAHHDMSSKHPVNIWHDVIRRPLVPVFDEP